MWRCPECKSCIRIFDARTTVVCYADGTEADGGFEWDDDNKAACVSCEWRGTVGEACDDTIL